jgi:hypothetical protein
VHYSIGFDLDERARTAIARVPKTAWEAVSDTEGQPRDLDDAGVVELTGLLRGSVYGDLLANWQTDMRVICRRERPSAGAQLSLLEEADGWRYQLIATNTPTGQPSFLEARHRPHRVKDRIRCGKDTGIRHLPSTSFSINQAWCVAAMIACDLLCWLRLLCLSGSLARAEPKTLTASCTPPPASSAASANGRSKYRRAGPGPTNSTPCLRTALALVPP